MIYTTLNKIKEHSPCAEGWQKLLKHLNKTKADDERLSFRTLLSSNGLNDAIWCCRVAPEYFQEWRLFAVWCARQVQHLKGQAGESAGESAARTVAEVARIAAGAAWAARTVGGAVGGGSAEAAATAQIEEFKRILDEE